LQKKEPSPVGKSLRRTLGKAARDGTARGFLMKKASGEPLRQSLIASFFRFEHEIDGGQTATRKAQKEIDHVVQ
jgi:hypothetical protein